jgi:hypothetical protein
MTKDEALRLALEALEACIDYIPDNTVQGEKDADLAEDAITAIKAALEAKDEPLACRACNGSGRMVRDPDIGTDQECFACEGSGVFEDTTTPPVAEPHKRKPLTDEEMKTVVEQELVNYWDGEYIDTTGARDCLTKFVRAIEAAHGIKEKNT